jgi:hypothetical protein
VLRAIVTLMMGEKRCEVSALLRQGPIPYVDESDMRGLNADTIEMDMEKEGEWTEWTPDPVDAPRQCKSLII